MRAFAVIPARGGSKRVPGKNTRLVGGLSLVERSVIAAHQADCIAWVSTDDDGIAMTARSLGAEVHHRPPQLATDHAQIESALAHWYTRLDDKPDAIVLLQPTSPFRTAEHVLEALRLLDVTGADSVVGVTVGHEHHFAGRLKPREAELDPATVTQHADTFERHVMHPTWYDFQPFRDVLALRPRTQDLRPMGAENGAIYAVRREWFEKTGNRLGGHMVALPMTRWEGLDVDDEQDLAVCNALVAAGVCK